MQRNVEWSQSTILVSDSSFHVGTNDEKLNADILIFDLSQHSHGQST